MMNNAHAMIFWGNWWKTSCDESDRERLINQEGSSHTVETASYCQNLWNKIIFNTRSGAIIGAATIPVLSVPYLMIAALNGKLEKFESFTETLPIFHAIAYLTALGALLGCVFGTIKAQGELCRRQISTIQV
jgi:hypothetical protein